MRTTAVIAARAGGGRPRAAPLAERLRAEGLELELAGGAPQCPDLVLESPAGRLCFCFVTPDDLTQGPTTTATVDRLTSQDMRNPNTAYVLAPLRTRDILALQERVLRLVGAGACPIMVPCRDTAHAADFVLEMCRQSERQMGERASREDMWREYIRTHASDSAFLKEAIEAIPELASCEVEQALNAAGSLRSLAVAALTNAHRSGLNVALAEFFKGPVSKSHASGHSC